MPLKTKTLQQIVIEVVTEWAGQLGLEPSLTSGDPLKAFSEAVASQQEFLQYLCEKVLEYARASTARGEDLDSWMADFSVTRNPAQKAVGQVRFFLKALKTVSVSIPVGAILQTRGGAIQYEVIADSAQTTWSEPQQAYVIAAGESFANVTVQALIAGASYNVQPNQLDQIVSTITGVDGVVNQFAIGGGAEPETDEDLRSRFILYINSLSKNTRPAIGAAIMSAQQGLNFNLLENIDASGNPKLGCFTVVLDDGSGDTPQQILDEVFAAIEKVRGFTIEHHVVKATRIDVDIQLAIHITVGSNSQVVLGKVQETLVQYVNTLKIGESLYLENLGQVAKDADSRVVAVQVNSKRINGVELDLAATAFQVIRTAPPDVLVTAA